MIAGMCVFFSSTNRSTASNHEGYGEKMNGVKAWKGILLLPRNPAISVAVAECSRNRSMRRQETK